MSAVLLLTHGDVAEILVREGRDRVMDRLIAALRAAFAEAPEAHVQRVREGFSWTEPEGLVEWMPVYRPGRDVHVKLVSYVPDNPDARGVPTIHAAIARCEAQSGRLTALADGYLATALRTGAASALATELLSPAGASCLGLIGCGAQALTQAHAIARVRGLSQILVHDSCPETLASFSRRAAFLGVEIQPTRPEQILSRCEILCTATSVAVGAGPVVADVPFLPQLHINAVGSDFPGKTELPRELLDAAFVVPDHRDQAAREGESQVLDPRRIGPELAALIRDPARAQAYVNRLSVFDSTGTALEDAVVLDLLTELAAAHDLGTWLPVAPVQRDPKDPYESIGSVRSTGSPEP